MIGLDKDVDTQGRKNDSKFYGYIPDDHGLRGRCFVLMTLMSALHNFSRSVGYALLAASGGSKKMWLFVCGEMLLYLTWKVARRDFMYWVRVEGLFGFLTSIVGRVLVKVVVDFSGCLQFRHPYDLGGTAFSLSLLWAQAMPFVALWLYVGDEADDRDGHLNITNFNDNDSTSQQQPNANGNEENENVGELKKSSIAIILTCSLVLWLLTNVAFFCTIDLTYLSTFWGITTAPQYAVDLFLTSQEDEIKFRLAFRKRKSYTKTIHAEIKDFVSANIDRWREEKPDIHIKWIPDEMLPKDILTAEGGLSRRKRRRSSLKEILGMGDEDVEYAASSRAAPSAIA